MNMEDITKTNRPAAGLIDSGMNSVPLVKERISEQD